MVRAVECLYKTEQKPKDPKQYQRIQKLADIKTKTLGSNNQELKEAIEILENYFYHGSDYKYEQIEELFYYASCKNEVERNAFLELLSIA